MKHTLILTGALSIIWMLWSGHTEPLLLILGAVSVGITVLFAVRMQITDEEGTPTSLGFWRPLLYAGWLAKEIVIANVEVAKVIVAPNLEISPKVIRVKSTQRTDLGRVIFANSITLTPGTVSIDLLGDGIVVHALSMEGGEEQISGDMGRRVSQLEG